MVPSLFQVTSQLSPRVSSSVLSIKSDRHEELAKGTDRPETDVKTDPRPDAWVASPNLCANLCKSHRPRDIGGCDWGCV